MHAGIDRPAVASGAGAGAAVGAAITPPTSIVATGLGSVSPFAVTSV